MNIWPFNIPEKRRIATRKRNEEAARVSVKKLIRIAEADAQAAAAFANIHINLANIAQSRAEFIIRHSQAKAALRHAQEKRRAAEMQAEFDELTRRFEERMKGKL